METRSLERPACREKDTVKINLKDIELDVTDRIQLAHDRAQRRAQLMRY
jgi:hypothetical protein